MIKFTQYHCVAGIKHEYDIYLQYLLLRLKYNTYGNDAYVLLLCFGADVFTHVWFNRFSEGAVQTIISNIYKFLCLVFQQNLKKKYTKDSMNRTNNLRICRNYF